MADMSEVGAHGNATCKMDVAERCRAEPLACAAGADTVERSLSFASASCSASVSPECATLADFVDESGCVRLLDVP